MEANALAAFGLGAHLRYNSTLGSLLKSTHFCTFISHLYSIKSYYTCISHSHPSHVTASLPSVRATLPLNHIFNPTMVKFTYILSSFFFHRTHSLFSSFPYFFFIFTFVLYPLCDFPFLLSTSYFLISTSPPPPPPSPQYATLLLHSSLKHPLYTLTSPPLSITLASPPPLSLYLHLSPLHFSLKLFFHPNPPFYLSLHILLSPTFTHFFRPSPQHCTPRPITCVGGPDARPGERQAPGAAVVRPGQVSPDRDGGVRARPTLQGLGHLRTARGLRLPASVPLQVSVNVRR